VGPRAIFSARAHGKGEVTYYNQLKNERYKQGDASKFFESNP